MWNKLKNIYISFKIPYDYLNNPYQCAQPALECVHHTVGGLERLLQLVGVHPLVGQGLFDLLEPRDHLWICVVYVVLQIPGLEGVVRIRGHLFAALLIRLENESMAAAADVGSLSIKALLIAGLLRLALVHILLTVASCVAGWTTAGVRSRAITAVLTARGANSCKISLCIQ